MRGKVRSLLPVVEFHGCRGRGTDRVSVPTPVQISFPYDLKGPLTPRFADPLPRREGVEKKCRCDHEKDLVRPGPFSSSCWLTAPSPRGRGWREAPGEGFPLGQNGALGLVLSLPTMNSSFLMLTRVKPLFSTYSGQLWSVPHRLGCLGISARTDAIASRPSKLCFTFLDSALSSTPRFDPRSGSIM